MDLLSQGQQSHTQVTRLLTSVLWWWSLVNTLQQWAKNPLKRTWSESNESGSFWILTSICDPFKESYEVRKHAVHLDGVCWFSYGQGVKTKIGFNGMWETRRGEGFWCGSEQEIWIMWLLQNNVEAKRPQIPPLHTRAQAKGSKFPHKEICEIGLGEAAPILNKSLLRMVNSCPSAARQQLLTLWNS